MNIPPVGSPAAQKPEQRAVVAPEPAASTAGSMAAPSAPGQANAGTPTREQVAAAVKHINASMPASSQMLEFSIDDDSKQTIVKIVDQNTKEVVRQIPSVEALEIAKSLDKMLGLLISQKA
jgi:flagellar protein FlaG